MSRVIEKAVIEAEGFDISMNEVEQVEESQKEVIERPYKLRKFKDSDLFMLLQILKKIGIKDCKEAFIQVASGEKSVKEIGILTAFDLADILIGNLAKAEDEIYTLYSILSGIPVEEMKEMEFGTLPLMIYDSFSEVKNTAFFKVLSKLL
jgi:hypothetical protein